MTELRQRMIRDMNLAGFTDGTQRSYINGVRQLAAHYKLSPEQLTEKQVEDYVFYLREEKKVAKTLRRHRELILNWFLAEGVISAGIAEGLNNKAKLTMRKAYGFRTEKAITITLYHQLGALPEPEFTYRFC